MISKNKVSLESFSKRHLARTFEWVSHPYLQKQFLIRGKPTYKKHRAYFEKVLSDPSQRVYAILSNGYHIGNCGLKNISLSKKEAELWIYIGDQIMRGKGIGRTASQLLFRVAFETLRLEKVYVHVASFNTKAIKLYTKLGFFKLPLEKEKKEWKNRGYKIIRMGFRKT